MLVNPVVKTNTNTDRTKINFLFILKYWTIDIIDIIVAKYKIEYTNPYYYSDLGQYVCIAYINREQAFNFVRPKLEIAKNQFPLAYFNALERLGMNKKMDARTFSSKDLKSIKIAQEDLLKSLRFIAKMKV